jgi:serine 3-dehydrogenase
MNRIEGKLALITGASSGIGEACARLFAVNGAHLILVARRADRLRRLKEGIEAENKVRILTSGTDVRDRESVIRLCGELERKEMVPDVLVNNAGLSRGLSKIFEGRYDDWDEMIDTNVKGLLNMSRCIIPMMVARDRGHVVNIGSIAGRVVYPGGNVYNATKFAVRALNEAMSIDLVGTKVRVSSIDPGATQTEFSEVRFRGDKARAKAVYEGFEPLRPEDIANAVLYVVTVPPHVNVAEMVIMPTAQRSPYVVHVEGRTERNR